MDTTCLVHLPGIEETLADLKNRRRQIARSVQEKVRESYGFLPYERRLAKKNALVVLTTMEKWFTFSDQLTLPSTILQLARSPQERYNRCWVSGSTSAPPLSAPRSILTKACSALRETSTYGASSPAVRNSYLSPTRRFMFGQNGLHLPGTSPWH